VLAASQKCSATFHRSHSSHHELSPTDGHPICGASLPLGQAFCRHDLGGKAHATRPRGSVWGPARTAPPGHNHSRILPLCTECEATSAPIDGRARPMPPPSAPFNNHLRLSGWPQSHTRPIRVDPRPAPDKLFLLSISYTAFSVCMSSFPISLIIIPRQLRPT
jgi:hypothetical protein